MSADAIRINLERLRVLVADPSPQSADMICDVLTGLGARRISRALDAREARSVIANVGVDLLVCDARLTPAEDADAFIRWFRRSAGEPDRFAPVLVVTAEAGEGVVRVLRDAGANFVLTKPFAPRIFLDRLLWLGRERRAFIETDTFVGPDRRFHRLGPPPGTEGRRAEDRTEALGAAKEPNLSQAEIDSLMKPSKVSL